MVFKDIINKITFAVLFVGAFITCSNNNISGGSTETVNTKIIAQVFASNGSVAHGAISKIVPSDWNPINPQGVMHVCTTDQNGFFSINMHLIETNIHYYNLLISGLSESVFVDSLKLKAGSDTTLQPITIGAPGSVSGIISLEKGEPTDSILVILPGTEYVFKITQGNFTLSNIPKGNYSIRFLSPDSTYLPYDSIIDVISERNVVFKDTVKMSLVRTLIDNFDDGNELLLHNRSDINNSWNSYWYIFNEKDHDSLSTIYPIGVLDNLKLLFSKESAYSGNSVYMKTILANRNTPYVGIACKLPSDNQHVANLSSLKSLSFFMKGKGTWRVSFRARALNQYPSDQRWGTWGKYVECPNEWEKITIDVSEIIPQPESPQALDSLLWKDVCDSVEILQFVTAGIPKDTFELYLDDIELHGVGLEDLR